MRKRIRNTAFRDHKGEEGDDEVEETEDKRLLREDEERDVEEGRK
jgi:hypothetical protein